MKTKRLGVACAALSAALGAAAVAPGRASDPGAAALTERARQAEAQAAAVREKAAARADELRRAESPEWVKGVTLHLWPPPETVLNDAGADIMPVKMTLVIASTLDRPVLLDTYLLERVHLRFEVLGPDGAAVPGDTDTSRAPVPAARAADLVRLSEHAGPRTIARGTASFQTEVTFPGRFGGNASRISRPGVYRIRAVYESGDEAYGRFQLRPPWQPGWSENGARIWTGRLQSEEVKLVVAPLSNAARIDVSASGWYRAGAWTYNFSRAESRSGADRGSLWKSGVPVTGKSHGERLDSPWGPLHWHAPQPGAPGVRWAPAGWLPYPAAEPRPPRVSPAPVKP